MNSINEKIIVVLNEKVTFSNGMEAKNYYEKLPGKYALKQICVENGVIVVTLQDKRITI